MDVFVEGAYFSGNSDSYINLGDPARMNLDHDITLEAWVKIGELENGKTYVIISRGHPSGSENVVSWLEFLLVYFLNSSVV